MASRLQSDSDDDDDQNTTSVTVESDMSNGDVEGASKRHNREPKLKGVIAYHPESAPKVSIKLLGEFQFYKSRGYCEPFLVLVDTLFLERYFLREENAVETIQDLLGGRFIFLLTNCVSRNFESKHPERLDVVTELYRCRDPVDYLRKDFECVKDVIKNDGIRDRLILATGNTELKRLMNKLSLVPIIYINELEVKDGRELAFIAYDTTRYAEFVACDETGKDETGNAKLLMDSFFRTSPSQTANILVDEGFIRSGLQFFKSMELVVKHVSELLGRKVIFFPTSCAFNRPSPYISSSILDPEPVKKNCIGNFFICGHTHPRPASSDCIISIVEKPEFAICFVATTCKVLKKDISKMRFVNLLSIEGGEIVLNNAVASSSGKRNKRVKATVESDMSEEDIGGESSSSRKGYKRVKATVVSKEDIGGASSSSGKGNKILVFPPSEALIRSKEMPESEMTLLELAKSQNVKDKKAEK